jgi:hypothetical protein
MKTRLTLTIDKDLLSVVKSLAMSYGTTVPELVEGYLRAFAMKRGKSKLIEMVEKLNMPPTDPNRDLIAEYYEAMAKKHDIKGVSGRKRNT